MLHWYLNSVNRFIQWVINTDITDNRVVRLIWFVKCNNDNTPTFCIVTMAKAISRVHPVRLMSADLAPGGHQLSDQANRFGL